ncbi:MAG TPA: hypothetical protein VMI31_15910, partial [Fimbriimonadaceae bacterium]|nr:hypothetical protein [Fimbriimonadaceae bacterium]
MTTYYKNTDTAVPTDSYWHGEPEIVTTCAYADIAYGASTPFQIGNSEQISTTVGGVPVYQVGMDGIGG